VNTLKTGKKQGSPAPSGFRLKGVGPQIAKHLSRLGVNTTLDLLLHLPMRYEDRTTLTPFHALRIGQTAVIEGNVLDVDKPKHGRTKLLITLTDGRRCLKLRFFHVFASQTNLLRSGVSLRCIGEVRLGHAGLEMSHPEWVVLSTVTPRPLEASLTPIYPATEGLSQNLLRKLTTEALVQLSLMPDRQEDLPPAVIQQHAFPSFREALRLVHRPPKETTPELLSEGKTPQQQRLAFEELLAHRLSLLQAKQSLQSFEAYVLPKAQSLCDAFLVQLPFALTNAQARVVADIANDLTQASPMLRLVQGDVGSGKTVVAAMAILQAVAAGRQAVLMAPTELLAEQHARVLSAWFKPLNIDIAFLSGSLKTKARKVAYEALATGSIKVAVGTHALFQAAVSFSNLALVVVDEQHRFGVHQRALLREKGRDGECYPHQLIMTATPIPRTLAMSFYADLDVSVIDELPPGRTPVTTTVIPESRRHEMIERVKHACASGRQVYWVCPLIDESDVLTSQAANTMALQLSEALQGFTVDIIHGRQSPKDKEAAMRLFKEGKTQVLVATTVIEVGVDVPNASVMVIENAERLGLSQLHQLRGRVGRGSVESYCVLLYQSPLSRLAKERLAVMRDTNDGFRIAERDLELRGPGEILGTRQTGELSFRIADLMRDAYLLSSVQQAATLMLNHHADRIPTLLKRWMPKAERYSEV
jgi:ATP-dependent DNA helicase RecG